MSFVLTVAATPSSLQVPAIHSRIYLKGDCPLAGLNRIFPDGIPIELVDNEPALQIRGVDCHRLAHGVSEAILQHVLGLVMSDRVPEALQVCVKTSAYVAIPVEWVDYAC